MEERSSSPGLDVERIVHHLQRPGFRISELQIGPAQQVPWHSHTSIGDTFRVFASRIRSLCVILRSALSGGGGRHGARSCRAGRTGW
jgi:hypothetical protein